MQPQTGGGQLNTERALMYLIKEIEMSVKQENRYRKLVISQGRVETDRQLLAEAMFMERFPRPVFAPPQPNASRRQVRSWMRKNADGFETATELAEAANAALDLPQFAMDDECHWVWEEALSAIELHSS